MNDDAIIEETDEVPFHDDMEEVEIEPIERRETRPWKALMLTGLLSGLIGVGGGAAAVYFGLKAGTANTAAIDTTLQDDLAQDLKSIETRLSTVEAASRKSVPAAKPIDLSPLEARLYALETATPAEISPETLSALKAAQEDEFDWPDMSALETRLAALEAQSTADTPELDSFETRLNAVEANVKKARPATIPKALLARVEALENRPALAPKTEFVSLLPLPKEAMLKAVEEAKEGGIFKRTLSKHVRVKDDDDPRTLIAGIDEDIAAGRLDLALNKYERLPEPVQAIGQAWYETIKQANVKAK